MSHPVVDLLIVVGAAATLVVLHPVVDIGLVLLSEEVEAFRPVERVVQRLVLGSWEEVRLWQWLFVTPAMSVLAVGPAYLVLTRVVPGTEFGPLARYLCAFGVVYVFVRSLYLVLSLLS